MLLKLKKLQAIHVYGAYLYAFLIPFPQKWSTVAIGCWLLLSIISFDRTAIFRRNLLLLPLVLYFTYLMGFAISPSTSTSFLEHKLSLIIFPFLFFLHRYEQNEMKQMMRFLVYGLLISGVTLLIISIYNSLFLEDGYLLFEPNILEDKGFMESVNYGGNYFFGRNFSVFHQTVYYALYLCCGIGYLLFVSCNFSLRKRIVFIVFFIVLLFLISNKAGYLVLISLAFLKTISLRIQIVYKAIGISLILIVSIIYAQANPRFQESIRKISNSEHRLDKNARYGFSLRLLSWDASLNLIKEKPLLGHGGGNAQQGMNRIYEEKAYITPLKQNLNAHNQFMQIWIENGITGLVIYLSFFIVLAYLATKNWMDLGLFIVALLLILGVNSLFESILSRFSGVSFFAYITCFVFSLVKQRGGQNEN